MKQNCLFCLLTAAVILTSSDAFGNIDLSGSSRNDAYSLGTTNKTTFNDIEETKLIFSHKTDEWRFYADLRVDFLYTISDGLDLPGEFVIPTGSANQNFQKTVFWNMWLSSGWKQNFK